MAVVMAIAANFALAKQEINSILDCGRYSVVVFNERGDCNNNPVVRGEQTLYSKYVLYPSGKIYPFLENKTLFASPNLKEVFRSTIGSDNITPFMTSSSFPEGELSWEELKEGRYRFFNGAEESIFFVPPNSEIEQIRASVEILQKNFSGEYLDLSLAHLFLTWRLYSNAIALLWDWQDSSPDANLMLAQAFDAIELPLLAENVRSEFVTNLAEKVLFFEFVSKEQIEKAIELIKCI